MLGAPTDLVLALARSPSVVLHVSFEGKSVAPPEAARWFCPHPTSLDTIKNNMEVPGYD